MPRTVQARLAAGQSEFLAELRKRGRAGASSRPSGASNVLELWDRAWRTLSPCALPQGGASAVDRVLSYSPGYCGWHISGQKKLFAFLHPEEIGIRLLDSFLMHPLKSVSGVFVCGPEDIHRFENGFAFCGECRHQTCRERIDSLKRVV